MKGGNRENDCDQKQTIREKRNEWKQTRADVAIRNDLDRRSIQG